MLIRASKHNGTAGGGTIHPSQSVLRKWRPWNTSCTRCMTFTAHGFGLGETLTENEYRGADVRVNGASVSPENFPVWSRSASTTIIYCVVSCADKQVEARLTHIDTRLAKGNMELAIRKSGNMALVLPDQPGMAASKFGKTSMFGNEDLDEKRTFGEAVGKAITSEHDLTQIVAVQPDDPFTRPQRLTVMLCLILGQTAVAAIFFGIDPSNIGMKVVIGIFTAILLLPSNLLFRVLFKKSVHQAKPKRRKIRRQRPPRRSRARGVPERYRITVYTTKRFGAGSDSHVMITIYGTHGDSGPIKLPAANAAFEPGGVDVFDLDLPYLGCMDKVMVGHDGTGFGSGWHLDRVVVRNITRREGAVFPCALWLDKRLDGGFLTRVLDADAAREAEIDFEDVEGDEAFGRRPAAASTAPRQETGTPIGSDSEGESGNPLGQEPPAGGQPPPTPPPGPAPSPPPPVAPRPPPPPNVSSSLGAVPSPPVPAGGVARPPRRRFRRAQGMYANYVGQGYIGLMPPQPGGGAPPVPGAFVPPPPPPPGAEGRMRPRRKRGGSSVGSTPGSRGVVPAGGMVPPPPMPEGVPVRPRRRRLSLASSHADSSAPSPLVQSPSRPDSGVRRTHQQQVARDQFGAVIPGGAPQPQSNALAVRPSSRRRGGKARAAMLANFGGQAAAVANGGSPALVMHGSDGAVPPAPIPGAPVRPRRRVSAQAMAGSLNPAAQPPAGLAQTGGRPRRRPGAGRTSRVRITPLSIIGPDIGGIDPRRPLAPPGMQVVSKTGRQARIKRALGALRGEEIAFEDGLQVPEAIESVVIKIQRAWKKKLLIRRKRQRLAAMKIQAHVRGMQARRQVANLRKDRAGGKRSGKLWWVQAHSVHSMPRLGYNPGATGKKIALDSGLGDPSVQQWMGGANKNKTTSAIKQSLKDKGNEEKQRQADAKAAVRRRRKRKEIKQRRNQTGLPRWFIYVTYFMAFAFCCVASLMIMLYGIKFEPAVARAWLLSSLFSAFIEIFVQQPVKIAGFAVLKERIKAEVRAFKDRNKKAKLTLEEETLPRKKSRFASQFKTNFNVGRSRSQMKATRQ